MTAEDVLAAYSAGEAPVARIPIRANMSAEEVLAAYNTREYDLYEQPVSRPRMPIRANMSVEEVLAAYNTREYDLEELDVPKPSVPLTRDMTAEQVLAAYAGAPVPEVQREAFWKRAQDASRYYFQAVADARLVDMAGHAIRRFEASRVGTVVKLVGMNLAANYVGSLLGVPESARGFVGHTTLRLLMAVPRIIRNRRTGAIQTVTDVVGVLSPVVGNLLGGFGGTIVGAVVGTIVDNRLHGILQGYMGLPEGTELQPPRTAPPTPQPPAGLSEAEQLRWYNAHRGKLYAGAAVAGLAATATTAMLTGNAEAFVALWNVTADGALSIVADPALAVKRVLIAGRDNAYVQALATAGATKVLTVPAGLLASYARYAYDATMRRAGVDEKTESLIPERVRRAIPTEFLRSALEQCNAANLACLMGEVLETGVRVVGTMQAHGAAQRAVGAATAWTSVEDARRDVAAAYDAALVRAQQLADEAKGTALDMRDTLAKIYETALRTGDAMVAPQAAEANRLAENAAFTEQVERSYVERKVEAARIEQERRANAAFTEQVQRAGVTDSTAFAAESILRRQQADALRAAQRLERFEARVAARTAAAALDSAAIAEAEAKSRAWMTREHVAAVEAFKQSVPGQVVDALEDIYGPRSNAVLYTAGKLYFSGGIFDARKLATLRDMAAAAQVGARVAHVQYADSDVADAADTILTSVNQGVRAAFDGVLAAVENKEHEIFGYNTFQEIFTATRFNPFATAQDVTDARIRVAVGDNSFAGFLSALTRFGGGVPNE